MGLVGQLLCLVMGQGGDDDLQGDGQAEALSCLADRDSRAHGRVAQVLLRLTSHHLQCRVEARGIAGGKQLLWVHPLAAATHLDRDGQVLGQPAVSSLDVTIAASSGGDGLGGVNGLDLNHGASWLA